MAYSITKPTTVKHPARVLTPLILGVILSAIAPISAHAQQANTQQAAAGLVGLPDEPAITYHTAEIDGQDIEYLALAGAQPLPDENLEPQARVFHVDYRLLGDWTQQQVAELVGQRINADAASRVRNAFDSGGPAEALPLAARLAREAGLSVDRVIPMPTVESRPVTFVFNGGPGSSSVWLHLGQFGPKRVTYADAFGRPGPTPNSVVDNDESLLPHTDLVFSDPVSTGYSRAEPPAQDDRYHSVAGDLSSVAEFIRLWLGEHRRWASPRFLAGESYGTTRAAGLTNELWSRHNIGINGVILISTVLNFQTLRFNDGNDLPYMLFLPTYTAVAHFHGALPPRYQNMPLREALREAERFALNDYALALLRGASLSDEEQRATATRMSELTGLGADFILRSNLRVSQPAFSKELLRDEGKTVGRLDARFTGLDVDDAGDSTEYDPSYAAIQGSYTTALNTYFRRSLGLDSDLDYYILGGGVGRWSYAFRGSNRYVNTGEDLRRAMHRQPGMRVFVASGYHDLATPYFASDYTVDHLMLRPELRDNVRTRYYEAGHMMYLKRDARRQLRDDLRTFYDENPIGTASER